MWQWNGQLLYNRVINLLSIILSSITVILNIKSCFLWQFKPTKTLSIAKISWPVLFKFNLKDTMTIPWHYSVFLALFCITQMDTRTTWVACFFFKAEQPSHINLVSLLFALNKFCLLFYCGIANIEQISLIFFKLL